MRLAILSALLLGAAPHLRAADFRVSSYTTGNQGVPTVASDANGNFVVVWTSDGQDGDGLGVFAQRYNAAGVAQGAEFQVNSTTAGSQRYPAVASDVNGKFVVVWQGLREDGSGYGIFGQRFAASGLPQGLEFRVDSRTGGTDSRPSVASDADGNFVVVWNSLTEGPRGFSTILGQRFGASGAALGANFTVGGASFDSVPRAASDENGDFVAVWANRLCCVGMGVFGQRFDASGTPQGSRFQANSNAAVPDSPGIAFDASGNFVVVWGNYSLGDYRTEIHGQRFDASGTPQGAEFQVNSYTTGRQTYPAVAADARGNFTVVWQSAGQDGNGAGIFGQRFNASGVREGGEFRVNSYTAADQSRPAVAMQPNGDPVLVWQSDGQDGNGSGVFGTIYGDLVFRDGFESGGLSHWSARATGGGDLSASPSAALAGTTTGLMALVNDTDSLYLQDDSPNDENRYRARFYFAPNGFDPGEASGHQRVRILTALDPGGRRPVALVLRRVSGQYAIEARVRRNDGTRDDTAFIDVTDAPHMIEFDWTGSSGPGASDGTFEMWIDGVPVAALSGLDNDLSGIDSLRMGALSVKTGASGTLYFDEFESRRESYIGPK